MTANDVFLDLGVALAAGLVVGIEREQSGLRDEKPRKLGGARTHPVVSLLGAVSVLLSHELGAVAFALAFVALTAFVVAAYVDDLREGMDRGITSEASMLLVFLMGAFSASDSIVYDQNDKRLIVLATAVVTAVILSLKPRLQAFVSKLSQEDLFATLKFLIVAVVVLPLLPNRTIGPLDVVNPRKTGILIVLIAGISFVGYVSMRVLGTHRGLGLTGFVGGLASSTAVTLSFSGRAKAEPALVTSCALAIVLASSIMFARIAATVAVANPELLRPLLLPLGAMFLAGMLASFIFYRHSKSSATSGGVEMANPFELSGAVKMAVVFTVVLLVAKVATTYFGTVATYLTGVLAGTTDVDAITVSMAGLAKAGGVTNQIAVTTILLGAASNTIVKATMAWVLGGPVLGRKIAAAFGGMLAAGSAGLAVVWLG